MAYFPPTGSVVTYQSVPSSNLGGSSILGQLPAGTAVLGSVATLQGTNPWQVAIVSGSVATATTNSSVMLLQGSGVVGSVAVLQGTNPWITNIGASVATVIIGGSVATATTNSSVMLLNSAGVIGSVATLQGTNPWQVQIVSGSVATATTNSSVMLLNSAAVIGSVAVLQGTNPWNISSVYGNISGSVLSQQLGTRTTSVVGSIPSSLLTGTYGHRNDAVASFLGGDLSWNPQATDSAGRKIIKPFTSEDGTIISYVGSVVSASVTLIQSSALGKKNYITDFWVVNTGTVGQLITFLDGSASVLGYTTAPASSGSNSPGIAIPLKTAPSQDLAFKATGTSSVVYMTVKGYQAP